MQRRRLCPGGPDAGLHSPRAVALSRWSTDDDRGGPPQPGWFKLRLCRGGPLVPAMIFHVEDVGWSCEVNGDDPTPPVEDWAYARAVLRVWHHGERATEAECRLLIEMRRWARTAQPNHPLLRPWEPINLNQLAPVLP